MDWTCSSCGEIHHSLPFAYGPPAPEVVSSIPAEEHAARVQLGPERCIVDQKYFFILGNVELPVRPEEGAGARVETQMEGEGAASRPSSIFSWNLWVSLSRASFERCLELWEELGREREEPYFGWLSSSLPVYPETLNLKTRVHTREVGRRPFIELEPTDHPLAVEQRAGITLERIQAIAEHILHGRGRDG